MLQPKVYIKELNIVREVEMVDFYNKQVSVYDVGIGFRGGAAIFSFDKVEFMENTGMKDKNGNYICEYDIVKYHDDGEDEDLKGSIFIVVKEQCGTSYYLEYHGFNMANLINSYQDITVIGNIYENKELLGNE